MVGGSGLYIDAICKGIDKIPEIPSNIRKKINSEFEEKGLEWLQKNETSIASHFGFSFKGEAKSKSQKLLIKMRSPTLFQNFTLV